MSNITFFPRKSICAEVSFFPTESMFRSISSAEVRLAASMSGRPASLATFLRASWKRSAVSSVTDAFSSVRPTFPAPLVPLTFS